MEWAGRGEVSYAREGVEEANVIFRRSTYAARDIAREESLTRQTVRVIKPGYGLSPKTLPQLLGRSARRAVTRGEEILWDVVA